MHAVILSWIPITCINLKSVSCSSPQQSCGVFRIIKRLEESGNEIKNIKNESNLLRTDLELARTKIRDQEEIIKVKENILKDQDDKLKDNDININTYKKQIEKLESEIESKWYNSDDIRGVGIIIGLGFGIIFVYYILKYLYEIITNLLSSSQGQGVNYYIFTLIKAIENNSLTLVLIVILITQVTLFYELNRYQRYNKRFWYSIEDSLRRTYRYSRFDTDSSELRIPYEIASFLRSWPASKRELFFSIISNPDREKMEHIDFLIYDLADGPMQRDTIMRIIERLRELPSSSRRRIIYQAQDLVQ